MTNPKPAISTRLNQLEDEFETVKQLLYAAASDAESANNRIDRLSERQDITQRQLDGLAVTVQVMSDKVDSFITKTDEQFDRLTHNINDFVEATTARNAVVNNVVLKLRDSQQSINAALERMETTILQLYRQNQGEE